MPFRQFFRQLQILRIQRENSIIFCLLCLSARDLIQRSDGDLEFLSCCFPHMIVDIRIDPQRELGRRMAQYSLNRTHIYSGLKGKCRKGVTEIMHTNRPDAGIFRNALKAVINSLPT